MDVNSAAMVVQHQSATAMRLDVLVGGCTILAIVLPALIWLTVLKKRNRQLMADYAPAKVVEATASEGVEKAAPEKIINHPAVPNAKMETKKLKEQSEKDTGPIAGPVFDYDHWYDGVTEQKQAPAKRTIRQAKLVQLELPI